MSFVALILGLSFILSEVFFRLKYPRLIGQILAGVLLGIPFFRSGITPDNLSILSSLSDFGIIFVLLLTGMQIDLGKLRRSEVNSVWIAVFGTIIPFGLGFGLMQFLGYDLIVSLVVGAALSLTAEGANLSTLLELKALNTKIGTTIMGAGILDDIFGTLFLSFVLLLAQQGGLILFPINFIVFVIIAFLSYKLFPYFLKFVHKDHSLVSSFSAIILFGILISALSVHLGLSAVLGALFAGVVIKLVDRDRHEFHQVLQDLKVVSFAFVVPFFFVRIGLFLNPALIFEHWPLVLVVALIATLGKVVGALIATPFTSLRLDQTHLIGWGMNSRGAIELIIAEIARANGLIPIEVYVAIVSTAVLTTLVFPFVLKTAIKRHPEILGNYK